MEISSKYAMFLLTVWMSICSSSAFTALTLDSFKLNSQFSSARTPILFAIDDNQGNTDLPPKLTQQQEEDLQWDFFLKHQARGKWRGTWTSYDYMGDVVDEAIASVNLQHDSEKNIVTHTHEIVVESANSECETCFDSSNVRTFQLANYAQGDLARYRCASVAMACGPSLLRSQAMNTELILSFGDGRLRVVYQHAPVWEKGIEPGSVPPQGLKLFRTMVSRETLDSGPPTFESETRNKPVRGNPSFFRPVPPFLWHKRWAGTSWTWGPEKGDRGWQIQELDEVDAWHGRPTGDNNNVWSMRLPGGILLQCPRVITSGRGELCRLAWLPEDEGKVGTEADGDSAKLLRVEASVIALEPIIDEESDTMRFKHPSLGSLRCDVLEKIGELENVSILEKLQNMGEMENDRDGKILPSDGSSSETEGDSYL